MNKNKNRVHHNRALFGAIMFWFIVQQVYCCFIESDAYENDPSDDDDDKKKKNKVKLPYSGWSV